ncbi:MAG: response regulator [Gemmatimonadaceae bacterium]
MSMPSSRDQKIEAGVKQLRDRFRASFPNTLAALRGLARELDTSPTAVNTIDALRRELHRLRGTAGSFGFPEGTDMAGVMEERAIAWAGNAKLDVSTRAAEVTRFVDLLERAFHGSIDSSVDNRVNGGVEDTGSDRSTEAAVPDHPAGAPPDSGARAGRPRVAKAPVAKAPGAKARRTAQREAAEPETVPAETVPPETELPETVLPRTTPRIVVVEDDQVSAEMLCYAIQVSGQEVERFSNGLVALEALLAMEVHGQPVLVLLDVDLPGMDGHTVHERLRVQRPGVFSVVFLTAHGRDTEQFRAIKGGALDYLVKPVNLRLVAAKLSNWLRMMGASV